MTSTAVIQALNQRRPFKLVTADGRTFEVPHPEFAMVSRSGRLLHVALEDERTETLDLLLVTSIQTQNGLPTA